MKLEEAIEILKKREETDGYMPSVYHRLQRILEEQKKKEVKVE